MLPSYQFLGSAYFRTTKEELKVSLDSINSQIYKASGTILVLDGEIKNELEELINQYKKSMHIKIIRIKNNIGLGLALRKGLEFCTKKYVLRFDTDDYNLPNRSLKQIEYIEKGGYDIISSWIYEFEENKDQIKRIKKVPLDHLNISKSIYFRNPMNHPSICFKRKSIINLDGGYRNCLYYEDYDLWIRALFGNLKFANMNDLLVGMKVTNQIESRKGLKLVFCELRLLKTFNEKSLIHMIKFLPFYFIRSLTRLLPNLFLKKFYYYFLRTS